MRARQAGSTPTTGRSWTKSLRFIPFKARARLTFQNEQLAKHKLLPGATIAQLKQLDLREAEALAVIAKLDLDGRPGPESLGWSHAAIAAAGGIDPEEGLNEELRHLQNIGAIEGDISRNDKLTIALVNLKKDGLVGSRPEQLTMKTKPHPNGGSNSRLFADEWFLTDGGRALTHSNIL